MLPPMVPRFWLAIPPVQPRTLANNGNSLLIVSCSRKSVYVHPAPIWISSAEISMRRSSGRFQMLTSLRRKKFSGGVLNHHVRAASDGKPCAGFLREKREDSGQRGRRDEVQIRRGALSRCGSPAYRLPRRLQKFACSPCSGKDCQLSPSRISSRVGCGCFL